jgi:hypothetical protein
MLQPPVELSGRSGLSHAQVNTELTRRVGLRRMADVTLTKLKRGSARQNSGCTGRSARTPGSSDSLTQGMVAAAKFLTTGFAANCAARPLLPLLARTLG